MSGRVFIEHEPSRRVHIWHPAMPPSQRPHVWHNNDDISESVENVTVTGDTITVMTDRERIHAHPTGESQPGMVIGDIDRIEEREATP
jgi:hypothetical protein